MTTWYRILKGISPGISQGTIPAFAWYDSEKPEKTSVRIAGTGNRTRVHPITRQALYRLVEIYSNREMELKVEVSGGVLAGYSSN